MEEIAVLNLEGVSSRIIMADALEQIPRADILIADANTAGIRKGLSADALVEVPAGEACKDLAVMTCVLQECSRRRLRRDSTMMAIGGGAVTDLAAMVAGVYLRGIPVTLVPSSLLAMVDAAVGGKAGVDLGAYKNLVGVFHPAREIYLVPRLLQTLSPREFLSGLAEVIKAAMLGDAALFSMLEQTSPQELHSSHTQGGVPLREVIRRAVLVKSQVVNRDFRESGERAFLNLGHTFGHALEAALGLGTWTHGEAVAWGIARAMETGNAAGLTDPSWHHRVVDLLLRYGYPIDQFPVPAAAVLDAMEHDKKRRRDGIHFVLQRSCEETVIQRVPRDILLKVLNPAQ